MYHIRQLSDLVKIQNSFHSPKLAVRPSISLGFRFLGRPFCRGVGAPLKKELTLTESGFDGEGVSEECMEEWW